MEIASNTNSYEFIDQEFLTSACDWVDTPTGLRQTSNAYGNNPGLNVWMGCMAIVKNSFYTDFILEMEARQEDDDVAGVIFGMDPNDKSMFYQSMMSNADWFYNPTDEVQGPFLKLAKKNGQPCKAEMMTKPELCYDLLAYHAAERHWKAEQFLNGRITSLDYIPPPYVPTYEDFHFDSTNANLVRYTVIVQNGQFRVFFNSKNNNIVGLWTDLPTDYAGGMVGISAEIFLLDFFF